MIEAAVSRCRAKDNAGVSGRLDSGRLSAAEAPAAERSIDGNNVYSSIAHHGRILKRLDFCRGVDRLAIAGYSQGHNPRLKIHSNDAHLVVAGRGNRSGDMCAVETGVPRIRRVISK